MIRDVLLRGALCGALLSVSAAHAAPAPSIPTGALEDGFLVEWVQSDLSPHTLADAYSVLNGTNGFTQLASASFYAPTIDLSDDDAPFPGSDPFFVVRVSGYIQLPTDADYRFHADHDDGILLNIGGEDVITYDADTPTRTDTSQSIMLGAGLYALEAIVWEQGGVFRMSLGVDTNDSGSVVPLSGVHIAPVPEPTTALMLLAGTGLIAFRRRLIR